MKSNKIKYLAGRTARMLTGVLLACMALTIWSCREDDTDNGDSYLYFKPADTELSYGIEGGADEFEMYTNMGPWVIEPEFEEDTQWIDVWPREGDQSGRFTITVSPNEGAYTRYATVNVVVNRKAVASFTITQATSEPILELDMGSNMLTSPSSGSEIDVPLRTNVGWAAEVIGDAKSWIEIGSSDDNTQTLMILANSGAERTGEVKFTALGTSLGDYSTSVFIKQFDTSKDPYNGTKKTVAQVLSDIGESDAIIDRNEWIEVKVTSDRSKLNLPQDIMFVQDESGRGLMVQFVSPRENIYNLNDLLKIHLYEASFVRDETSKGLKLYPFLSTSIFEYDTSEVGVTPVVVEDMSRIGEYENTLVTLPSVEFAIPLGTYVNMDETKYAQVDEHATSAEFHDGNQEFGHILRDKTGNTIYMYSRYTFLDRFVALMPEGSGAVTGIVTNRTKNNITTSCLRIRNHSDNQVSASAQDRLFKTHTRFGPFVGRQILTKVSPEIGSGQLKTTMWENVTTTAGTSIDWAWSYARRTPATITITPDGTQVASPQLSSAANQMPEERMFSCLSCQRFWNYTGSTMNREGMGSDQLGEAWVLLFNNINGVSGDLYLDFTYSSSATGPMYYSIEWSEREDNPISLWNQIPTPTEVLPQFAGSNFIAPEWNYSPQLKEFSIKLPEALKSKSDFAIRIRVTYNWRSQNNGSGIAEAGAPRTSYVALRESQQ